ncbi:hypothetical protein, partial [Endozoicomonas sp.]|uniref:hypothetical protein n=1 Tax=Endozoicomonas sp. TaxID=1892382 RepID=UPI00383A4D77
MERELKTPPFAIIPKKLHETADVDLQSTQERSEAIDGIKSILDFYLNKINKNGDYRVTPSVNFVSVRKEYVNESRHIPGQPTVMVNKRTLDVRSCLRGDIVFRVDITEGYDQCCLPICGQQKLYADQYIGVINTCSLEQLVQDMLWACLLYTSDAAD